MMKVNWQEIGRMVQAKTTEPKIPLREAGFYSADYWETSKDFKQRNGMLGLCFR